MLSVRTERNLFAIFTAAFVLGVGGFGLYKAAGRQDVPAPFMWLSYLMMAAGAILLAYALLLMFTLAFTPDSAHQKIERRGKVMARYLLAANGAIVVGEMPDPELDQRAMLKVEFEDGDIGDFRCEPEVFKEADLHRSGLVAVRGGLIVSFAFDPKTEDAPQPSDVTV